VSKGHGEKAKSDKRLSFRGRKTSSIKGSSPWKKSNDFKFERRTGESGRSEEKPKQEGLFPLWKGRGGVLLREFKRPTKERQIETNLSQRSERLILEGRKEAVGERSEGFSKRGICRILYYKQTEEETA